MDKLVAEIFKEVDEKLISNDVKVKVAEMLNKVVDDKVTAKTTQIQEENSKLKGELETLKNEILEKEEFLKEAARDLSAQLALEMQEKEQILEETLKEYQEQTIAILEETAKEYKESIEAESLQAAEEYKSLLESDAMAAAAEFKRMRQAADAEQLESFKNDLIEKADEYMRGELKKSIPQNIMEAAAKAHALEPLVESIVKVIETQGIAVDKTGFETLKKAKEENTKLNESLNTKAQENVKLGARVKSLEKQVKLAQLTEGLTLTQKEKALSILESCSLEELDSKFSAIKESLITESVKSPKIVSLKDAVKSQTGESPVQKQVTRIVESDKKSGTASEMDQWVEKLKDLKSI